MKNLVTVVLFLLFFTSCFTSRNSKLQSGAQDEIRTDFIEYYDLIIQHKFADAMEFIVPEFFNIFPKDELIQMMEQLFNNPMFNFQLKKPEINEVGKIIKEGGQYYAVLKYSNWMNMHVAGEDNESESEKKDRIAMLKGALEITFGSENVKYNEETDYFEIFTLKEALAVSENGKTNWKFITVEENQKMLLKKIIPERILTMFD